MNKNSIGLALSGGGYRAAAYHIGTMRALNKLGILGSVDVISAVSGGSITAAYYAMYDGDYQVFEESLIQKLQCGVLTRVYLYLGTIFSIMTLCDVLFTCWLIIPEIVILFFFWYYIFPISNIIEYSYNKLFFSKRTLSDISDKPIIAINATDVSTGKLFTFSQQKMSCYPYYRNGCYTPFNNKGFPVAKAVMASSCVPFAFSPIKISRKYYNNISSGDEIPIPMLIDGGLYDNQGSHKLSMSNSAYHTDYIIVSDAGNTQINSNKIYNPICLLIKTSDIMMDRIKRFQRYLNLYSDVNDNRYAYIPLEWNINDRLIDGFVRNIKDNHIPEVLLKQHNIVDTDIINLKNSDQRIALEAHKNIILKLKENIKWEELSKSIPSCESIKKARSVGTNLTGLKLDEINALIEHSALLAEIQIRLYLPDLIPIQK